jgi:hypothetical protein
LAANLWTNPGEIPGNGLDDDENGLPDDVHGWDFVNNDPLPEDDFGHGTHVSGTVGAVGNNSIGVTGTTWNSKLMILKACNSTGRCPLSATLSALQYAVDRGAKISNNSYGGLDENESAIEREAIAAAGEAGHLFVAAAGNDGLNTDPPNRGHYPSDYDLSNVISVGASGNTDALASFSNYGIETVDLLAPGINILSTDRGGGYSWASGTSMAAPHVSGVAALLASRRPAWGPGAIQDRIISSARPVAGLGALVASGGVLDAWTTVDLSPAPPTIISGPQQQSSSRQAQFAFIGEPRAQGFECRFGDQDWSECQSPQQYLDLDFGPQQFAVRQIDARGQVSLPESYSWSVILARPEITSSPPRFTNRTRATVAFSGAGPFQCQLGSGDWSSCQSPSVLVALAPGEQVFSVRQIAEGVASNPASVRWVIDQSKPVIKRLRINALSAGRFRVDFKAYDRDSGLSLVRFSTGQSRIISAANGWKQVTLNSRPRWVEVKDRAGNFSSRTRP